MLATWDIRSENRHIAPDGTGLFADYVKCEYNQQGPFCSYFQTTRLILGRRGLIRATCIHLHQATRLFQLSRAPRTYCVLDQTANDLSCAWSTRRSDQRQSELLAENALLRHQLIILRRQIKRPVCQRRDRLLLVLLARMVRTRETGHHSRPARDASAASIMNSSVCSGSVNHRRTRESRGSRLRRSA